ncbi:glucosamine inositolphosphorylceramide transferase family protein [Halomonas mongoliensis]|uniref:glucosamine inositolphosphorylceramide transferase family protein n=1 Tax=Halomonas mongoliensis TaxID=321265 RepID=UPI00403B3590
MTLKVAILARRAELSQWQVESLNIASRYLDVALYLVAPDKASQTPEFQHMAYRLLTAFSLNNRLTRRATFAMPMEALQELSLESGKDGLRLPFLVVDALIARGITAIINFGPSIEPPAGLDVIAYASPGSSYYGGGAAGFEEMRAGAQCAEIRVEKHSANTPVAAVLAHCYSRVYHHSYMRTASDYQHNAMLLLKPAMERLVVGDCLTTVESCPRTEIPGNLAVMAFVFRMGHRYLRRLLYGALVEKRWNVIIAEFSGFVGLDNLSITRGRVPVLGKSHSFYADPFFSHDGQKIRLEALNKYNGVGEILELDVDSLEPSEAYLTGWHYSYPFSFCENGREYLLPEVSSHSEPYVIAAPFTEGAEVIPLEGFDGRRVLDGTLFIHDGYHYIFGGLDGSAESCLYLYYSQALTGPYRAHPKNPIVIDPRLARMGGRIQVVDGQIYRFGQNNSRGYGDGLTVCEIVSLSPDDYRERIVGSVGFVDACGPHTVDISNGRMVMDFYTDTFSLFAGYRRLSARILRQLRGRKPNVGGGCRIL